LTFNIPGSSLNEYEYNTLSIKLLHRLLKVVMYIDNPVHITEIKEKQRRNKDETKKKQRRNKGEVTAY